MFKNAKAFTRIWCLTNWVEIITDNAFDGSSGRVVCCPAGTFFNASTGAKGKCEFCAVGKHNNDTRVTNNLPMSCDTCPRNTFAPIEGLSECSPCEPNQYSNASSKLCSTCPSGKKMLHKTTGTVTSCAECDAGQFQDEPGIETCKDCPKGFYQNGKGVPYCVGCVPGQYQDQRGNESCIECASGRKFNASIAVGISASDCVACDKGQHQPGEGSTFCLPCLTGTFQNVSGSPSCNDCPIGFSNGGTKEESCTGCQKGRFQDAIREAKCKGMSSWVSLCFINIVFMKCDLLICFVI